MNSQLNVSSPARGSSHFFKRLITLLLLALSAAQLQGAPDFSMKGWGTVGKGTTGGAGGRVVRVSTPQDLVYQIGRSEALIIEVKGMIDLGQSFSGYKSSGRYYVASNKTIIGIGSDAGVRWGGFVLSGVSNVIIRNLTFRGAPDDAIAITHGATNVWVDHNDFASASDGLVDVSRAADLVTVSWNRFSSHDKTCLAGASDGATGDRNYIRVTYHDNWFIGTNQRHPRVRYGKVHVFNNFYDATNVGIGIGVEAQIFSEHNFFQNANLPYHYYDTSSQPGYMRDNGSIFGKSGLPSLRSSGVNWKPSDHYAYTVRSATDVPNAVRAYSGVGIIDGTIVPQPEPEPQPSEPLEPVGLVAFYPLTEGSGTTAKDESGFGSASNLTLSGGATWVSGKGVSFGGGEAKLQSSGAASKLADQIAGTGQFSVELWARPGHLNQPDSGSHPSRIVSFSIDGSNRNFMIGHGGEGYQGPELAVRLRTTGTADDQNGMPNIVASGEIAAAMSHYVITFDGQTVRMYRDGQLRYSEQREGDLTNWDPSYLLVFGNETSGSRGWVGELREVAIYDLALSASEIADRYAASGANDEINTFSEWLEATYPGQDLSNPELSDPTADPSGCGVPNLIRYALGVDPQSNQRRWASEVAVSPTSSGGESYLTIEFNRRTTATDLNIIAEASSDLKTWEVLGQDMIVEVVPNGDLETVTVRDSVPLGAPGERFMRVRVEIK